MRNWCNCLVLATGLVLMLGCSSSHPGILQNDPIQPGSPGAGLSSGSEAAIGNTILWGYWEVQIDSLTGTFEIVPLRGVQWTVDVVMFMQPPAGPVNSLIINVVDMSGWLAEGHIIIDVTLVHPFPGLYEYTGSDVRGVFITTGQNVLNQDSSLAYSDGSEIDPYLANPDGYSRWMNPVEFPEDGTIFTFTPGAMGSDAEFDATLNGYRYFANGLGENELLIDFFSNPDNLSNRGQFTPSSANTRQYDLYFPLPGGGGTPIPSFQYAVLASWVDPVDLDPGDLPGSFPVSANCDEAFLVNVVDESTLYYTTEQAGGDVLLNIEIFDWTPYLSGSGTVLDEIEKVIIESPQGVLPIPYVEFGNAALTATALLGTTDASSIVSIEITDCLPVDVADQQVVITIEHSGGLGYDNGGVGTVYPTAPLASFFFHTLNVAAVIPQADNPAITSIDPDYGITDTYIYDVIVNGDNLTDVYQLRLLGDTDEVAAYNLQVIDDEHLQCELDLATLPIGFYDVIADHPDLDPGILVDGFEVMECPCGIHDTLDEYTTTGEYNPAFASAVIRSGPYAGQVLTNSGSSYWGRLDVGEPPADNTPFVTWTAKQYFTISNNYAWALETDPVNGVFAYASMDDPEGGTWPTGAYDYVKICDQDDGTYIGLLNINAERTVAQVDFDEFGNLWVVYCNQEQPNRDYFVQRWDYDPGAPSPYYTLVGTYDLSTYLYGSMVISDVIVLQRYRRMFIASSKGSWPEAMRVQSWDISGSSPAWLDSIDLNCNSPRWTNNNPDAHQRFTDMEVDRSDDILAGCRILAMFQGNTSSPTDKTMEFRKLDVNLNQCATSTVHHTHPYTDDCFGASRLMWYSSYVIDDINGGRVIALYDNFCVPPPGYYAVFEPPTDW